MHMLPDFVFNIQGVMLYWSLKNLKKRPCNRNCVEIIILFYMRGITEL